jgi:hypothetical protein
MTETQSYRRSHSGRSQKQGVPENRPIETRQVYAAIADDEETRSLVLARFRSLGGSLDRWQRHDRALMSQAFTAGEDALELRRPTERRDILRSALRDIRRRLEREAA